MTNRLLSLQHEPNLEEIAASGTSNPNVNDRTLKDVLVYRVINNKVQLYQVNFVRDENTGALVTNDGKIQYTKNQIDILVMLLDDKKSYVSLSQADENKLFVADQRFYNALMRYVQQTGFSLFEYTSTLPGQGTSEDAWLNPVVATYVKDYAHTLAQSLSDGDKSKEQLQKKYRGGKTSTPETQDGTTVKDEEDSKVKAQKQALQELQGGKPGEAQQETMYNWKGHWGENNPTNWKAGADQISNLPDFELKPQPMRQKYSMN